MTSLIKVTKEVLDLVLKTYISKKMNIDVENLTLSAYSEEDLINGNFTEDVFKNNQFYFSLEFSDKDMRYKFIEDRTDFVFKIFKDYFKDKFTEREIQIEEILII